MRFLRCRLGPFWPVRVGRLFEIFTVLWFEGVLSRGRCFRFKLRFVSLEIATLVLRFIVLLVVLTLDVPLKFSIITILLLLII